MHMSSRIRVMVETCRSETRRGKMVWSTSEAIAADVKRNRGQSARIPKIATRVEHLNRRFPYLASASTAFKCCATIQAQTEHH